MTSPQAAFLSRPERARVLYVFHQHDYSGAEVMQLPLLLADVDPLAACPPDSLTEAWLAGHGIPTVPLRFRPLRHSGGRAESLRSIGRGLMTAWDLRRILRRHRDRTILCCTSVRPGLLTALAQVGLSRKALWVVTDFLPKGVLGHVIRRIAAACCDSIAPSSQALAGDFVGGSSRLRRRTTVIHPGAGIERFSQFQADGDPLHAIIVGHISPTKRTLMGVEIARLLSAHDFRLRIVGKAQYRSEDFAYERRLEDILATDPDLRRRVELRGHATDVREEMRRSGLLLHCRPDEPFGMVMVEAMAMGLPVVAPRSGGPLEIVQDERTGLLFEPEDPADAARQIMRLMRDPDLARRMGAAGRERATTHFSAEAQLRQFDALLAALEA